MTISPDLMTTLKTFNPADLWRRYPRESAGTALLVLIGAAAIAGTASSTLRLPGEASQAVVPQAPPMEYRPVAPLEAVKINQSIPVAGPGGVARPFIWGTANSAAQARALECLTSAIYYEAGQEPSDGQRAVAQVILNRVRHPAFPASVCGVVYEGSTRQTGCQFTFTCDGSMARTPMAASWDRARKVAALALAGSVYPSVGNATHYHADYVVPYWASSLAKTAVVGAHLFYRWSGGWGRPGAFGQPYSARESDPRLLRMAALSVTRVPRAPDGTVLGAGGGSVVTQVAGTAVKITPDGKRVRVLFTPQAREAVEKIVHKPYVERVAASDNLRYTLGDNAHATTEQAFGKKAGATDTSAKAN